MNRETTPELSIRSIPLPANVAASLRASRFRQAKGDCIVVFAVFTFLGLGVVGIAEFLSIGEIGSAYSVATALLCGMLAALGMLLLNFANWPLIRKALKTGSCVEAMVTCERATRARFAGNNLDVVALDCGNDVLLLVGDWWLQKSRSDLWIEPSHRKRFPAKRFRIQFLPESGNVLSVECFGGRLKVAEPDVPPLVTDELAFSKYAEVVHVKQSFQSLIAGAVE